MSRIKLLTVGELARVSGVSVRTLHHYDDIGLLPPAARANNGRRHYDRDSVLRLQQILTYRILGFSLAEISRMVDDPGFDRRRALLAQRSAILERIAENKALLRGIDEAIGLLGAKTGTRSDMASLFQGFDPSAFADEAKARWGKTNAWAVSQRRTKSYTEADWAEYKAAHGSICQTFADHCALGTDAGDKDVQEAVAAYAQLVDRWFYPIDPAHMHQLAALYDGDSRFQKTFNSFGEGTAAFVIEAFSIYSRQNS